MSAHRLRRNRTLAEALDACGQIERSGLGVDLMIQAAVRRGQSLPAFDEPDGREVRVTLFGPHDPDIIERLGTLPEATWDQLTTHELIALDAVRHGVARSQVAPEAARHLVERGLIEPGGRGDAPYVYSGMLETTGGQGLLTFPVIRALAEYPKGASLSELATAIGTRDTRALKRTLQWMRRSDLAYTTGRTRGARWHLRRGRILDLLQEDTTD